jgi:hypothetical protein
MANLQVKDATATSKYLKASGTGSDPDPHVVEHLDTNSAAILAALQAIQTAIELVDNMISGSEGQVDVVTSALPTGAATETTLAAIQTAVQLIDNMISGSEAQVDVVAALPAGTNQIGDVVVNDLEDGAGTSAMDSVNHALKVNVVAGSASGVSHVDDAAFTPATDDIVPAGAMFDDTSPDAVDEGDAGVLRMSSRRELYAQIRDAAGNERGLNVDASGNIGVTDAGGALTVDGTVTVQDGGGAITVDGTVTADAGTGPWPVTDNGGNLSIDDGGNSITVDDGGAALTVDGTVAVSGTVAVTDNSGSLTVDGAVTATLSPATSGGLSIYRSIDLDETEEEVKGSAGQLYGAYLYNDASSGKRYVKVYDATAATVVVGTTTPVLTIPLDAGQGAVLSFEHGIAFSTAITIAATTGIADNDTGAPGDNEVIANVFYK